MFDIMSPLGKITSRKSHEEEYWRLAALLTLGVMISTIHFLGNLGAFFPLHYQTSREFDDTIVWAQGLQEGEGLCHLGLLTEVIGTPPASVPYLSTINLNEEQQGVVSGIHPRAALLFFQPIPLNLADAEVLAALPGIGPAMTARIIAKREELGGFQSIGQLRQVRGIGAKTLRNLQDRLIL
jgi:competence ComEA-like helix-hairpin-helix protein